MKRGLSLLLMIVVRAVLRYFFLVQSPRETKYLPVNVQLRSQKWFNETYYLYYKLICFATVAVGLGGGSCYTYNIVMPAFNWLCVDNSS